MWINTRIRFIILTGLLLLSASINTYAQKTQVYERPEEQYYHGVELYDKEVFGPAVEVFERFLESSQQPTLLTSNAEIYALLAHLRLGHRGYDKILDKHLDDHPQNSLYNLALFELGNYHFQNKKYNRAARYYDDVDLSNIPKDKWDEAHFKMGYSFFETHDYNQAKDHFNKIRNQQGEYYTEANYFYGYICYKDKDFDCALSSFERVKDNGPSIIHLYIAQIYYAKEAYQAAIQEVEANQNEKYKAEYDLLLGKCYFQLEAYDKASKYFEGVDLQSPILTNEDKYMIGFTQFLEGNHDIAQTAFVQLSGMESNLGQLANYQLGQSFLATNDKQKAFHALGVAKRMDYNAKIKELAHFNYAKLAFELGSENNAIRATQDFIEDFPNSEYNDEARGYLAEMLVSTNNYTQAIRVLEEIKSFNKQSKAVYQKITYYRAEQLFDDRNYDEAQSYFNKSLKFTPDATLEAQSYFWIGELYFIQKNYQSARSNYARVMNSSDGRNSKYYGHAIYGTGYTYYMENDINKAINYFSKFAGLNEANTRLSYDNALRLGDCYFLKKNYAKAIAAYAPVASANHSSSDYALFQTGIIHGLEQNYEKKIQSLGGIETRFPSSVFVDDALFQIGDTYFKFLNKPERALSVFNRIISKHSGSVFVPACYLKIASIYFQNQDFEKSMEYCKQTIEEFPNTKSAKEAYDLGESVAIQMGMVDEWIDYINGKPNSDIRITYQDSLLFESSLQKYRLGDCDGASKGFNSYKERFGKSGYFVTEAHYYLAECAYQAQKYDVAADNYKFVADQSLSEHAEDATYKLAELYFWQKKYTDALPYFSKLERLANSKLHYTSAVVGQMRCNYTLGNIKAAKKNATDVLPIENIETEYLIEANLILGKIQFNDKNYLTALFHLDFVVKQSKTEKGAEAQYYRCMVLFEQQKYDDSRNEIFSMSDAYASYEYWVVKGFVLLSDIYIAEKDYFQARATLQSLQEAYEGDQSILDEIQERLKKLDELENAPIEGAAPNNEESEDGEN